MDWVNSRAIQHYSNGTMNIYKFIILLGLNWVTHTDTIYTWFLRSLVRFFFLRFSLFTSDEMQLSNCSTWHLVCCPCAETCTRTEILEPVSCVFFSLWGLPHSQIFQSAALSERARISVHIFCLFCRASLSVAILCYFTPKQCKKQTKWRTSYVGTCVNIIIYTNLCVRARIVWESHGILESQSNEPDQQT